MIWFDQPSAKGPGGEFDLSDRGLLLADGVFTTALVVNGKVAFRGQHITRLMRDSGALGLAVERERIEAVFNEKTIDTDQAALRVTLTRGAGERGLFPVSNAPPTIIQRVTYMDPVQMASPKRIMVSDIRRNESSPTSRHKTLSYIDNVLALKHAGISGFDDCLFLNTQDYITCTSAANILAIFGNEICAPPIDDGVLPGITTDFLMTVASEVGLTGSFKSMTLSDLQSADEVFLANSLRGVVPVAAIADRSFATKRASELFDLWRAAVGLVR
ncbi:MAG: aminotransferase class IV [Pseudomonadota bacterium]